MDYVIPSNFYEFGLGWYQGIDFRNEANLLLDVINQSKKENDIQNYIKEKKKWFIPASIFKDYDFGHHEAYLVPEQELGEKYRVDYMLLGRNSIGHQIVLVEFENANVDYLNKTSNMESESVRKGLVQIMDWKCWMDDNRDYFLRSCGLSNISGNIPSWAIHYCLVVSRRDRMDERGNRIRGQKQNETPRLNIVTYDRLVDNVRMLVNGF